MYSVLVVDDEELICLGIRSMIERVSHPEISTVLIAANANEAETIIKNDAPNIVITDIQMPGVNGLELIKSSIGEQNKIKFIVLSGYDDFQYVREALKLGVMDYLLKPASLFELKDVLENAVLALNMEKKNSGYEKELKYRQLFLENNLRKIFMNKSLDEFDVRVILDRIRQYFQQETFTVGIVRYAGVYELEKSNQPEILVLGGERHSRSGSEWQTIGFVNDSGDECIIVNHSASFQNADIAAILKEIVYSGENLAENSLTIALSNAGTGIESLIHLYKQAERALSYKLIMGQAQIIAYASIKDIPTDTTFADQKMNELHEMLKIPQEEKISGFIDSVFGEECLSNRSIDCASRLFNGISRQLSSLSAASRQTPKEECAKPFESFVTLRDIRIYLKELAFRNMKSLKEEDTEKTVIASTMNYIRDNLGKEISLAVAANRANISYTHFSRLFKKQTGMNFSEYLIKARMAEGKRLLDDPALKIYEIAGKIGYGDPKHFTRAFRLFYGVSPMEYRAKIVSLNMPYPR